MNFIVEAMNSKIEKTKTNTVIIYSNTGMGKSSIFRNAPSTLFLNLENRLGHIEGTFKEVKLPALKADGSSNIDKIREAIKIIGTDYNFINRIKELISKDDKESLKKAKESLKEKFDVYLDMISGKIDYPKLLVVDNVDDIYTSIAKEVCDELKLEYLGADDRNLSYGIAKQRLVDIIRQLINIGCNVVLLASVTPKTEAWNTAGLSIPFLGSGSSYQAIARKISGVFAIDDIGGNRCLITNNNNTKWFIKNSFDRHWENYKLPAEIPLNLEDINKWIKWFTEEDIKNWKEIHGLKTL